MYRILAFFLLLQAVSVTPISRLEPIPKEYNQKLNKTITPKKTNEPLTALDPGKAAFPAKELSHPALSKSLVLSLIPEEYNGNLSSVNVTTATPNHSNSTIPTSNISSNSPISTPKQDTTLSTSADFTKSTETPIIPRNSHKRTLAPSRWSNYTNETQFVIEMIKLVKNLTEENEELYHNSEVHHLLEELLTTFQQNGKLLTDVTLVTFAISVVLIILLVVILGLAIWSINKYNRFQLKYYTLKSEQQRSRKDYVNMDENPFQSGYKP